MFEFVRNAANGLGKGAKRVMYEAGDIDEFLQEFLNPIFEHYKHLPVNSASGRYSVETIIREHLPLGDVLVELSGCDYNTVKT